jgi:molybdenum cofactor cytidylyltransferase
LRVRGLLLAAGSSRRFPGGKLLAPLPDSTPMALASAAHLLAALPECTAVVGAADGELAASLAALGMSIVHPPGTSCGLAHSLAAGVAATCEAEAWVIALADMPLIRPATIAAVAAALEQGAALAAPVYRGRRGHPVGVARALREELLALTGDQGARAILQRHADRLRRLPCDDPGTLLDVDTPADLQALAARG